MGGINDELSGNVDSLENTVDVLKVFQEQMVNIVGQVPCGKRITSTMEGKRSVTAPSAVFFTKFSLHNHTS